MTGTLGTLLLLAASALAQHGPFSLSITPQNPNVPQGATASLFVKRAGIRGGVQDVATVTWSSSNQAVASVNAQSGLVTTAGQGNAVITVVSGPLRGSTLVHVGPVALQSITVTPADATVASAGNLQFTATGLYSDGNMADLTTQVTWSSQTMGFATISNAGGAQGKATGISAGSTMIMATLNGIAGATGLNVDLTSIAITPQNSSVRVGKLLPFTAIGTFADASTHNVTSTVLWSSDDPSKASIFSTGLATGVGVTAQPVNITAQSPGATSPSTSTGLTVLGPPALFSLSVNPPAATKPAGRTQQFSGTGTFDDGSSQDLTSTAFWTSSDQNIAIVDTGLATALLQGTAQISAFIGSLSASSGLTVTAPVTLLSITVSPANPTIANQGEQQFTAIGHYSDTSSADITGDVEWNSSSASVAVINVNGLAQGVTRGTTTIQATQDAVSGSTTAAVTGAPRFAYGGNADATLSMYVVDNRTGQLRPNGYLLMADQPYRITADPLGRFVYSTSYAGDSVSGFRIDSSTGSLVPTTPPRFTSTHMTTPLVTAIDPAGKYAYVADQTAQQVTGFAMDQATGNLTELPSSPYPAGTDNISITVDPLGRFVYVSDFNGLVYGYALNIASGALAATPGSPYAAGNGSNSLRIDPKGQYAYVTNQLANTISGFSINAADGSLTPLPSSPYATGGTDAWVADMDPLGRFFYAINISSYDISAFKINLDGSLTAVAGSPFHSGTTPFEVRVDPTGKFVYVANDNDDEVAQFAIQPTTGALSRVNRYRGRTVPLALAISSGPTPLTYHPSAAYTINNNSNDVSGFSIDGASGQLAPLSASPYPAGTGPILAATDVAGKFLYVTDQNGNEISIYSIDPVSGNLTPVTPGITANLFAPTGMAIDSSGRFAYATNRGPGNNGLIQFARDPATGALTQSAVYPLPGNDPVTVQEDPTGQFLYVVDLATNNISGYIVSPADGTLAQMPGSPYATGNTPVQIALEPSGRFAYVAAYSDSTVWSYTLDPGTGVLRPIGSPTAAGVNPNSITVDPSGRDAYVPNVGSNNVSAFTINPVTGALTPTLPPAFAAGTVPAGTAVELSGQFSYTVNFNSNNVSAYSIDAGVGTLTPLLNSPFATGTNPNFIVTTGKLGPPAPRLLGISVAPGHAAVAQGVAQQFMATGIFSDGHSDDLTTLVAWNSSNANVAVVSPEGLALGRSQGAVSITASQGGASGAASLAVSGLALSSLSVTPANPSLPQGNTLQFVANGTFSDGSAQELTPSVIWESSAPGFATISSSGLATSVAAGATNIKATSGALSSSTTLTVLPSAGLQSITVTPANPTIVLGSSQQFTATGHYVGGAVQDITRSVTWTTAPGTFATINASSGLAASTTAGTETVTAMLNAVSGNTSLQVAAQAPLAVLVAPAKSFLARGNNLQLAATAKFSNGSQSNVTGTATWTTSNPSVATVSPGGLVTATGSGTAIITANFSGIKGTATVTVF